MYGNDFYKPLARMGQCIVETSWVPMLSMPVHREPGYTAHRIQKMAEVPISLMAVFYPRGVVRLNHSTHHLAVSAHHPYISSHFVNNFFILIYTVPLQ